MLQALIEYAEREDLGDADFHEVPVRWLIPLDAGGKLNGNAIELLDDPDAKKPRPKTLIRPFIEQKKLTVASRPRSFFLCDTLERAVNFPDLKKPERAQRREGSHAYFKQLLKEAVGECPNDGSMAQATLTFLNQPVALKKLHASLMEQKAKPNDNITFQVSGRSLLESEELKRFWRDHRASEKPAEQKKKRLCLATGELIEPVFTTEKIKGVPGGLAVGTNLISFDKAPFTSFGLRQGENASLSVVAELKIRSALNALIQSGLRQNEVVHLHWTRNKKAFDPFDLVNDADEQNIRNLLEAPHTGEPQHALDASKYYAMSLSGNGGRIIVRDWLESTVPKVEQNVRQWFADLTIVRPEGDDTRSNFKFGHLLYSLVRKELKELPPQIPTQLLYAALRGTPLPLSALAMAVRRQQIDTSINPARLALIKACLMRQDRFNLSQEKNNMTEGLNHQSTDPAYLCGRLFSALDRLQRRALGTVNAGVKRYHTSASTTPAMVMGRLLDNAENHLAKIGNRHYLRRDIESITGKLNGFPTTLDTEGQGRFFLGWHHQNAEYWRLDQVSRASQKKRDVNETSTE